MVCEDTAAVPEKNLAVILFIPNDSHNIPNFGLRSLGIESDLETKIVW